MGDVHAKFIVQSLIIESLNESKSVNSAETFKMLRTHSCTKTQALSMQQ